MPGGDAPSSEAEEITTLQQRLAAKRNECVQLEAALAEADAQKVAAHQAGLSGIKAAKNQMVQLRAELLAAKRWIESRSFPESRESGDFALDAEVNVPISNVHAGGVAPTTEEKTRLRSLQVQARELRHELSRWKHQVDLFEAKRPKHEDEIISLKAELTHTLDIWSSTQHAVKHHEVEREFRKPADGGSDVEDPYHVPLHGGGHGTVEAHAERQVREKVENRNINLSGKAKRLGGVVAAQQLLIQRLEKQVLQEERSLEQKDRQLHHEQKSIAQLRGIVRHHSDSHIAGLLGISPNKMQQSASAPRLPTI